MRLRLAMIPLPLAGFLALAVAMGIGRFAFTPILPMMQTDFGISLAQGGWLASANYLGYMFGALYVTRLKLTPDALLRIGLWLVVLVTAAMGLQANWWGWLLWRLLAGMGSAFVMIGTASLCIARLNAAGKPHHSGLVFAGVGSGIALAGLACMGLNIIQATASMAWLILALAALLGLVAASTMWREQKFAYKSTLEQQTPPSTASTPLHWRLIIYYGIYGFGYILPATFLPAQARELIPDPWLFSLAWPVFGIACALSTLIVANVFSSRYSRLQIWAGAHVVMAIGVFLPVIWHGIVPILIAAICVGSTFMVITMVGLQEGQARVGASAAKKQMAAMTAAFGLGQLLGPIFFSLSHQFFNASLSFALVIGTIILLAGVVPILRLR